MKKKYHTENLKEKILETMYYLMKKDGYESITIRKLGAELNVSSTAIYRHFKNVDEAMLMLIHRVSNNLADYLMADINESAYYIDEIIQLGENFLQFSIQEPHQYSFLFFSPYTKRANDIYDEDNQDLPGIYVLMNFLEKIKKSEGFTFDTKEKFIKLWSFILGYSILVSTLDYKSDASIIRDMVQNIFSEENKK